MGWKPLEMGGSQCSRKEVQYMQRPRDLWVFEPEVFQKLKEGQYGLIHSVLREWPLPSLRDAPVWAVCAEHAQNYEQWKRLNDFK